jgi:hypothetical protein
MELFCRIEYGVEFYRHWVEVCGDGVITFCVFFNKHAVPCEVRNEYLCTVYNLFIAEVRLAS